MAILFLILIVLFAISSSYYLYRNDFNSKTIEVIFPAVGAIFLSLYLGVKSIWIDAPEATVSRTSLVFLQDTQEASIHSLIIPHWLETPELYFRFRGLKRLMRYRTLDTLKNLPEWEDLKSNESGKSDKLVANLLEFAFLDWLSNEYVTVGHFDKGTIIQLKGASQSYGIHEGLVPLVQISVKKEIDEHNPFILANDITIKLPSGSKITRENLDGPFFRFLINTPNSEIEFRVLSKSGGSFNVSPKYSLPTDELALKIKKILQLPEDTPSLQMYGMSVEIITRVKAFSRYSDQAEIESKWHKNIVEQFDNDYSWDKLRERYISM
jgi:hypothetical protein